MSQTPAASQDADPDYKAPRLQLSLADFELLRRIGDGSFSHVVLARHKATDRLYALKVIDKQYVLRHQVVEYIRRERALLDSLQYRGIVELHFTFQDAYSLYLGLEYCPNGELYDQIRLRRRLSEPDAAQYAAEIILILEQLRAARIVHRDLKPENLLLDEAGHLKLIDFGSAKLLSEGEFLPPKPVAAATEEAGGECSGTEDGGDASTDRAAAAALEGELGSCGGSEATGLAGGAALLPTPSAGGEASAELPPAQVSPSSTEEDEGQEHEGEAAEDGDADDAEPAPSKLGAKSKRAVSLVGTAEYVSPEVLNNQAVSCAADLWALGCVIYQMLTGRPPFKSLSEYLTFQKIVVADYSMPEGVSAAAADLIARLLKVEPSKRIGAYDLGQLRTHCFFRGIDWDTVATGPAVEYVPDMEPAPSSAGSSFDWELQSLASALPPTASGEHFALE